MPMQKGKRRRKPRRHGVRDDDVTMAEPAPEPAKQSKKSARPARQRWSPPYWVNAIIGLFILAAGVYFFFSPLSRHSGQISGFTVLWLVLYIVMGGVYLGKAWRQMAARRAQNV